MRAVRVRKLTKLYQQLTTHDTKPGSWRAFKRDFRKGTHPTKGN